MPQLLIKIKDKIAKPLNNCVICDNSDYTVKFIFDEEWEKEPLRIARFIWNKQYVDVQFTGDTCEAPIISKTNNLAIGVYAGNLRTTTPAILTCYTSILSEDVIEHSVTPSEYEEIMKLLNAQATDIAALKAVDKKIWTNLDTINKTASAAKVKAEEGVAKADDALTATRTNANKINTLETNFKALDATDERIWTNLDTINRTASTAKLKAEEGVAKADDALARNIFTDEEKAKLANITNPIIIKGRVDTAQDLPTEAEIGWFYFVGLESASSYQEYCYSENGWEYIGLSQEGVDLSNYYTKAQVDTTVNELKAIDNSLGTRIDNVDSKASAAKIKAEEGVAKADNALTATRTNATNISTHETRLDSIDNTLSSHDTRITTAQQKANSVDEKVDATNKVVGQLSTSLQSAYNKINAHANDIAINRTTLGTQCKNLLKNTAVTKTVNGVTFTVNSDGSVTVNGTNTSSSSAYIQLCGLVDYGNSKLIASIGQNITDVYMAIYDSDWNWIGTGSAGTISWENSSKKRLVRLAVKSGATINNVTVYPMIRYADITDDTYEPYKESIDERLIKNKSDVAINRTTLGTQCKNLLKNTAVTKTVNGVTFTVNNDKSITVSGTATNRIIFLVGTAYISQTGNYTYTGTPSGGAASTYSMNYRNSNVYKTVETGNGITAQFEGGKTYEAVIDIRSGVTVSNLKFYPMLRYADITDDTYEPYKENMNERLIKNKSDIAVNKTTLGYQSKNLLKLTLTTKTVSGITFTVNDDYSITLNGTSTAIIWQEIGAIGGNNFRKEKLIFTGNPAGTGSGAGLEAWYMNSTTGNKYVSIANGNTLTESDYDPSGAISYEFHINKGRTYNNVTFYPMLRYADIQDDTYEPYKENVDERLIENKSNAAVNRSTLGYQCKNLLKNTAATKTFSGVTFTVNSDGSVTVNANNTSSSAAVYIELCGFKNYGTGKLTASLNSTDSNLYMSVFDKSWVGIGSVCDKEITWDNNNKERLVRLVVKPGATINNVTVYPMIRYADITDDTYEPYQPSLVERCLLKDTAGINLGHVQSSSITIDNLSAYTALWVNVSGGVSGINFATNLIVPVAYLAKSSSNRVSLAGGIPSSAYVTSEGPVAAKYMDGTITAKISGNTLDLTISDGTIGSIEVISLM